MMEEEEIVVYLHGNGKGGGAAWYRVVLLESRGRLTMSKGKKKKLRRQKRGEPISPAAVLRVVDFGFNGGWAVIEDDIYVAGGSLDRRATVYKDLIKHNIHHPDPTSWEKVFSLKIPRASPFLAAVGRKLAVVAGTATATEGRLKGFNDDMVVDHYHDNSDWTKCGEIYDLDNHTSDYLISDIKSVDHYQTYHATIAAQEEPTRIVFYSLDSGSMLILDASTGDIVKHGDPDHHFALRSERDHLPPGLEGCEFHPLFYAASCTPAVFHNNTFYYLTYELKLCGYDVLQQRWFLSECLGDQCPLLKPKLVRTDPDSPLLLGLPNGKFLALIFHQLGVFTMASLSVVKNDSTLDVTVEHIQYFHPDNPFFCPFDGKAIRLKNTGSGTMRGGVRSATES